MKEISYTELLLNPVTKFADEWVGLVTGKKGDKVNAMTLSWGAIGSIWGHKTGMPVVTIYVRPQRFSKALLDKNDYFTLCFFDGGHKKELGYLGTHSGKDEDKIRAVGFTSTSEEEYSYINEAKMILICRKLYRQTMKEECFLDKSVVEDCYPKKDFHDLYIAQIEKVLIAD
jgi:flavin reductase (DIM6/NTAB) family NADH-FMN oxidoreductase RutF